MMCVRWVVGNIKRKYPISALEILHLPRVDAAFLDIGKKRFGRDWLRWRGTGYFRDMDPSRSVAFYAVSAESVVPEAPTLAGTRCNSLYGLSGCICLH